MTLERGHHVGVARQHVAALYRRTQPELPELLADRRRRMNAAVKALALHRIARDEKGRFCAAGHLRGQH